MKKNIIAGIALVVLGVFAAVLFYFTSQQKATIESVLPREPIAYTHIVDIEKGFAEFQKTKLWRSFSKVDIAAALEGLGVPEEQVSRYQKASKNFSRTLSNPLLLKVFGQEVSIALYSGKQGSSPSDTLSGLVVVTRLAPLAQFLELLSSFYGKADKKLSTKQDTYKGFAITSVELERGFTLSSVKIKDLLLIGFSNAQLYNCIDAANKTQANLTQDETYRLNQTHLDKTVSMSAYVDMQAMLKVMTKSFDQAISKMAKAPDVATRNDMFRSLDKFIGFKSMGISFSQGETIRSKFVILYDKSKIDTFLAKSYSFKPTANSSLKFVPRESMLYQWGGYDPKDTWQYFKKELSETSPAPGPSPMDIIRGLETGLEVDLEKDVVPNLGNEAGSVLVDIDLNGPVPIPGFMIFTKVNKKEAFEKILNSLLEKNNFATNVTDHKNKSIKYVVLPLGENLQPGFCFLDNYLLIATSHKVLKACIDAYDNQAMSLAADKDFTSLGSAVTEKANQISFLRTTLLLERLKGVGDWLVGWMALISSSAEAYEKHSEQAKAILVSDQANLNAKIGELKEKISALKSSLVSLNAASPEAVAKKSELAIFEKELRSAEQVLSDKQADLARQETSEKRRTNGQLMKPKNLKIALDEIVYPILEGLKYFKVMGSATVFKDGCIESVSYIKTAY